MDPNECWRRWALAANRGDTDEATEARQDLLCWLQKGGFEPGWNPETRELFMAWTPGDHVDTYTCALGVLNT